MADPLAIWHLCADCAKAIPGGYTVAHNLDVARLLFGTATHESDGFKARRQYRVDWGGMTGGFSLFQLERISILESRRRLAAKPDLDKAAAVWLFEDDRAIPKWCDKVTLWALMHSLCSWDRAACLFARLHYLWAPTRIPESVSAQAMYWKQHYNTAAGKGTPEQWIDSWLIHCDTVVRRAA